MGLTGKAFPKSWGRYAKCPVSSGFQPRSFQIQRWSHCSSWDMNCQRFWKEAWSQPFKRVKEFQNKISKRALKLMRGQSAEQSSYSRFLSQGSNSLHIITQKRVFFNHIASITHEIIASVFNFHHSVQFCYKIQRTRLLSLNKGLMFLGFCQVKPYGQYFTSMKAKAII